MIHLVDPQPCGATRNRPFRLADFFCGAGGTSSGASEALRHMGYDAEITAVNHWEPAIRTHEANHPAARHFHTNVDDLKPGVVFPDRKLDALWASPSCRMHSQGNSGELDEQDRATAHCVTRWAEALLPETILIENVPQFKDWGPLHPRTKRPITSRKGETFHAWLGVFRSLGYKVDYRVINCADHGDPTTRERLMIQCVLGNRRRITWPEPTHAAPGQETDLFGQRRRWIASRDVIDTHARGESVFTRGNPLCENTLGRIRAGLPVHNDAFLVTLRGTSKEQLAYSNRSLDLPLPTVSAGGIHAGICTPVATHKGTEVPWQELPENLRKKLVAAILATQPGDTPKPVRDGGKTYRANLHYRMLSPKELALAQGFPEDYIFTGKQKEILKQIGNAVPRNTARAVFAAAVSGNPTIHHHWHK